jgi:hypothetical protein
MKWIIRLGVAGALLLAAGCAHRSVNITSQPIGALVYINGVEAGRTPMKYDFDLYGDFDVILRMEGYQTLKTHQNIKTPIHEFPPFDLLSELFGVREKYDWNFEMTPVKQESVDPQTLIAQGTEYKTLLESSEYTRAPQTRPLTRPAKTPEAPTSHPIAP